MLSQQKQPNQIHGNTIMFIAFFVGFTSPIYTSQDNNPEGKKLVVRKNYNKDNNVLLDIKKGTKTVAPFTIGGFALSLAHEYKLALRHNEFPRLSKKRIGRAFATIMPPTALGWYIAYKYEQLRKEIND